MKKRIVVAVALAVLLAASTYAQTTDFFKLVANGTTQQVQDALKKGADVNARNKDSFDMTPLMFAALGSSRPGVINALLKAGADVTAQDATGKTAVMWAAASNPSTEVLETLLNCVDNYGHQGANTLYTKDVGNMTVLMWAAWGNPNPEVITLLLKDGPALAKMQDDQGKTALDYAQDNDKDITGTKAYRQLEEASQ